VLGLEMGLQPDQEVAQDGVRLLERRSSEQWWLLLVGPPGRLGLLAVEAAVEAVWLEVMGVGMCPEQS